MSMQSRCILAGPPCIIMFPYMRSSLSLSVFFFMSGFMHARLYYLYIIFIYLKHRHAYIYIIYRCIIYINIYSHCVYVVIHLYTSRRKPDAIRANVSKSSWKMAVFQWKRPRAAGWFLQCSRSHTEHAFVSALLSLCDCIPLLIRSSWICLCA